MNTYCVIASYHRNLVASNPLHVNTQMEEINATKSGFGKIKIDIYQTLELVKFHFHIWGLKFLTLDGANTHNIEHTLR